MFKKLSEQLPSINQEVILIRLEDGEQECYMCTYKGQLNNNQTNHYPVYRFIDNRRDYIVVQDYMMSEYAWIDTQSFIKAVKSKFSK